jgi:hypothetical protein
MADILPFTGPIRRGGGMGGEMGGQEGEAEIFGFPGMVDEYTTMTGIMSALQQIQATVEKMMGAKQFGRVGVVPPARQMAEDVVRMTGEMLDTYRTDVKTLAAEDNFASEVLVLLEELRSIVLTVSADPYAVRVAAKRIGRTLSMSQGIISELEDSYGMARYI